ncbi:hypothetical protein AVEN_205136-1 [Araneus ventricosus]|uniref:Uncharacterized protein n=1 Tax=Araneus ventricosus TaxID=182803 RepID=A0A4Y2IQR8_ARAVE|nr:hypothetical protein AVEN_205136-1 [Araneus ventricosus]
MPFLFTFCTTQPPEIGAIAKITLRHCLRESHAFIGADVTGDEDPKQARFESCVYKNVLELQSSWNTIRAHLPNWTSFGHTYLFCLLLWSAKFRQTACRTFLTV